MKQRSIRRRLAVVSIAGAAVVLGSTGVALASNDTPHSSESHGAPNSAVASQYPSSWSMYAGNSLHNPAYTAPAHAQGLMRGYY